MTCHHDSFKVTPDKVRLMLLVQPIKKWKWNFSWNFTSGKYVVGNFIGLDEFDKHGMDYFMDERKGII
jgi:hypothetical protein